MADKDQMPIRYSRGTSKFDNSPEQRTVADFDEFEATVLADSSPRKHLAYVCAPLTRGVHREGPERQRGLDHWRLKGSVEPRAFLSFDFDAFADETVFQALKACLEEFRGFGYTTASHTAEKPRARAILQASRPVSREEGIVVCQLIQSDLVACLGDGRVTFDQSVYRGEQPIYTPVDTATAFHFDGAAVDVDAHLSRVDAAGCQTPTSASAGGGRARRWFYPT